MCIRDRVTPVGRFIRRTSIDELPQLFNVLMGTMSLVGPRPERPQFVDKFKEEIPHYMIKHQVRPGLTGWAQVNGYRGDTSIRKRIEYDLYYIENWTIGFDFKIILLDVYKRQPFPFRFCALILSSRASSSIRARFCARFDDWSSLTLLFPSS